MEIKILGDTDQARGKAFERLIVTVLDHLGYTDFKTNIRPAAMELDIEAIHKTKNKKILCECKAHKDPIGPHDVELFHSKLNYEIDKENVNEGLFFSTSGFTSNAVRWYEDSGERTKKILSLNGLEQILQFLRESNILTSNEIVDIIVKNKPTFPHDN